MKIGKSIFKLEEKANNNLFFFSLINYTDKGLIFLLPLFLIYFYKDKSLYNDFEFIYSWASIVVVFVDLGVRNYLMYSYKQALEKENFIDEVKNYILIILVFLVTLSLPIALLVSIFSTISLKLFSFIVIRTLFVFYTTYFLVHTRLIDRPARSFLITITVNFSTIFLVAVGIFLPFFSSVYTLFFSQFIMLLLLIILSKIDFSVLNKMYEYVLSAIKFSWPIIANVLIFNGVNNFAKIYAYSQLSEFDMFNISIAQRGSLFIQITHASLIGFYIKKMFVDDSSLVDFKLFFKYLFIILGSSLISILLIFLIDKFASDYEESIFGIHVLLVVLYTVLWCISAFFETYYHKNNKTIGVLFNSLISSLIVIGVLLYFEITINTLIYSMLLYMLVYSFLTIFNLYKLLKKR